MGAVYPAAVKDFRAREDYNDIAYAAHVNDLQDEVTALQGALGVNPHVDAPAAGTPRTYTDVSDRLSRSGIPSVTIEAYAKAPFFLPRVDHGPFGDRGLLDVTSTRWDVVRRTVAGEAPVEDVCVPVLDLPAGRTWLASLWVGGVAEHTGTATVHLVGRRLFTRASAAPPSVRYIGSSYVQNTTTSITFRDGDAGYRTAEVARPSGEGWSLTKVEATTGYQNYGYSRGNAPGAFITREASWTRVVPPFKVTEGRTSYFTQVITNRVRTYSTPTVAGEPFNITANDFFLPPVDISGVANTTADRYPYQPLCTRFLIEGVGANVGRMRFLAVSTDVDGGL